MTELADTIAALLLKAKGNPAAMMHVARMMRAANQLEQAMALCQEVLALAGADAELVRQANRLIADGVPKWHFSIVRDEVRNATYDAALRRAVRPGSRVLEIGTGTGLLAMMAARAGAAEVVTCEMNPAIAATAREIIARNGFADRIRVLAKHSDALEVEADLGGPADILVSEIVSNDLLAEHVLPVHERAVRHLLKPGAPVIPARGLIRVAPAEDAADAKHRMGEIDGFDLSPFNRLMTPVRGIRPGHPRLRLRGEAVDVLAFDLGASAFCAPARASATCRAAGGRVNGIVQWIVLDMDGEAYYENRPGPGAVSCWSNLFHPLPQPIDTVPGQELRIFAAHDRHRVTVWCDTPGTPG